MSERQYVYIDNQRLNDTHWSGVNLQPQNRIIPTYLQQKKRED